MKDIEFHIFRGFAWLVSHLPMPVIYFLSDILRLLIRYVIRYRRKVILENLTRSFPEKSRQDILKIKNRFYKNLADITLEIIKLQKLSGEELLTRFEFKGFDIMQRSFASGRSIIVAIGHCGNWEWMGTALGLMTPVKGYAIVKPLSSRNFNNYIEMLRHRLNPDSTIPFKSTYRTMARHKKEFQTFNVIASDQTPLLHDINYWHLFLNQDTPFFLGVEKLAISLDFDVIYIDIKRISRGKYLGDIALITDNPKNTRQYEITDKFISLLEDSIKRNPDNWLWSHRRWKHKKETTQGTGK